MTDQPPIEPEAEAAVEPLAPPESGPVTPPTLIGDSFVVVHQNASGHAFATRVSADSSDAAGAKVLAAHEDNTIENVVPDDGLDTHGYGGALLEVQTLDEEP